MENVLGRLAFLAVALLAFRSVQCGQEPACDFSGNQHNFTLGAKSHHCKLLYSDNIALTSPLQNLTTIGVSYPAPGTPPKGTISYVEVTDKRTDGSGGCVTLGGGGVGSDRVQLTLVGQPGRGFDFHLEVWGH